MTELRKKTEGATDPAADRREYVVGVELLASPGDDNRPASDEPPATNERRPSRTRKEER